jgi:hypothetical protein
MTREDKELLLKDLCSRLPYGVKIKVPSWDEREMEYVDRIDVLYSINGDEYIKSTNEDYDFDLEDIKPYLFPFEGMTDEQYKEYWELEHSGDMEHLSIPALDWLNKNHFDYRGLIPKGLAIDATNLNIY